MSYPNALEVCRAELYTTEEELREKLPALMADKVMRVREMYNWALANPTSTDREFIERTCAHFGIHRTTAYSDLGVVKALLPMLGSANRDYHRWRASEMLLNAYNTAEKRKDTKTMERAAASYAKMHRVDVEDEQAIPLDKILVQPFTATDDPRVLGIEPIPNIQEKISTMIAKYRKETIDIEDVSWEEVDLEEELLFPDEKEEKEDYLI